jgi:hypothetical protein
MSAKTKTSGLSSVRVRDLSPFEEQREYVFEQLSRALGPDWLERNERLADSYWRAVVAAGYALPDEHPADDREAA